MEKITIEWLEVPNPQGANIPAWKRSVGLDGTGTLLIPAAIAGNEERVLLCAMYDGTKYVNFKNHAYLPSDWLAREFPECRDICVIMENHIKMYLDKDNKTSE